MVALNEDELIIETTPVTPVRKTLICPIVTCRGPMEFTGRQQPIDPPNNLHRCKRCAAELWVRGGKTYPRVEYVDA